MVDGRRSSICSGGIEITYFWHACTEAGEDQVKVTVDELMAAIQAPGRLWNPWTKAYARRAFEERLRRAVQGQLAPVDEVKPIEGSHPAEMFEIRWSDIAVIDRMRDREVRHEIHVRLLHAEPQHMPLTAIGLRAHEKQIFLRDSRKTHAAQNAEIEAAQRTYYAEMATTLWGEQRR